jgi:hypothetical protein
MEVIGKISNETMYPIIFSYAVYGDLGNINARSLGKIQRLAQDGDFDMIIHNGKLISSSNKVIKSTFR